MTRLTLAGLTSGIGALVLGIGLGGLFPQRFDPAAALYGVCWAQLASLGMLPLAR